MPESEKLYVVQLKPFEKGNRHGGHIESFQSFCIGRQTENSKVYNGISGMGWAKDCKDCDEDFMLSEKYHQVRPLFGKSAITALNIYRDINVGDFLLTRLSNGECYLGKVKSEAYHTTAEKYEDFSFMVDVLWCHIGQFMLIPNAFRGLMQGRINTANRTNNSLAVSLAQMIYSKIAEGKVAEKIKLTQDSFHEGLDSDDLEDLVGAYVLRENPSYTFIPSSCKKSEKLFEFKLSDENGKHVTCQTKNFKPIDVAEYDKDGFEKIYLFSGIGKYINCENVSSRIEIIDRAKLFEIIKTQFLRRSGYFYHLLKEWYTV